ncbi:RNA-directed DNA polymerase, eukaryota [Tanacetum coccineum]
MSIKNWCKTDKQRTNASRHSIQHRIFELDLLMDKGMGNEDLVNERNVLIKDLQDINSRYALDMAQKAKIRWAIEGDENSKYFHGIINKKQSELAIRGVLVDGDWIEEPSKVKNEFLTHFSNLFSKPTGPSIKLDPEMFRRLSIEQNVELESNYWKIIDQDVVNAVQEFFVSSKFPPGCNSSFITLIPKKQDAKVVKDFRPISLIGSIYKIISKIMANRLSFVISDLISDVQSAFVSNRQILDGPFILNELISWCKYHKSKAMIFKVDFEKAFDSVRWDYLDDILDKFGFGAKWRGWIQGCFNSAMGSILVNGCPTSEFKFHKGLKQGDPLSPFLFILVMESLHLSFNNILSAGLFKGIRINDSLTLSHLFYADDAVFIGKWDKANIITIVHVLKCFFLASGLKINIHKSKLMGIGVSNEDVTTAANLIGCTTFTTPFNYLGVKVGVPSSKSCSWDEVLTKISARLSKWKLKTLSIGGRLTLIKSVLTSLPLYHMSIYKVPMGVLNRMESIRRRFFIGADNNERKISMIGWQKVLASKKKGGLGVSSFFALNRALLFKWIWRFISHGTSLWSRVIKAIYGDHGALNNPGVGSRSSLWYNIIREIGSLSNKGIKFLSHMKNKVVTVAAKLSDGFVTDSFRRIPHGGIEEEQLLLLVNNLESVVLADSNDRWIWLHDSSGEFSVQSARSHIDDILLPTVSSSTRWVNVVPIKINIFAWKMSLDKLPTRLNLSLRGIEIPSIICPICSSAGESGSHLFFGCNMARLLLRKVTRWWELEYPDLNSYEEWLAWFISIRLHKGLKDVLEGVFYVMWWAIWKFRNQVLFGSSQPRLALLFDEIVLLSFTWCSSRCKNNFDWISWLNALDPYLCNL